MAVSLECRVPLLDQRLVALAAQHARGASRCKTAQLKHLMKQALAPASCQTRYSIGKSAGSVRRWARGCAPSWRRSCATFLSKDAIARRGLFDPDTVAPNRPRACFATRRSDRSPARTMNLEIWCRLFLDGRSPSDVTAEVEETRAHENSVRLSSRAVSAQTRRQDPAVQHHPAPALRRGTQSPLRPWRAAGPNCRRQTAWQQTAASLWSK